MKKTFNHVILFALEITVKIAPKPHLISDFDTLVSVVRERLAWNKSTGSLLDLQLVPFANDPTLTQHQCRTTAALHPLEDVVFCSLCREGEDLRQRQKRRGGLGGGTKKELFLF